MNLDLALQRQRCRRRQQFMFGSIALFAALLVVLVASARASEKERRDADARYVHTLQVLLLTGRLNSAVEGTLHVQRSYVLTAAAHYRQEESFLRRRAEGLTEYLAGLTRDNPQQRRNIAALASAEGELFAFLDATMVMSDAARADRTIDVARRGGTMARLAQVEQGMRTIEAEERRLLVERSRNRVAMEERASWNLVVLPGVGLVLFLFAVASAILATRAQHKFFGLEEELEHTARTDPLTGLPNRRCFEDALAAEIAHAGRTGAALSLAIVDLDFFKRINDTFGHLVGDEVLRAAASTARVTVRGHDMPARIGGEEFAIMMPETNADEAEGVSDRVRAAMAGTPIRIQSGELLSVTASVGTATLKPGESATDLLARADAALYEAKTAGRNAVRLAA
jgi:diguanylate cyclase (GGDEF)-like protein